MTPIWTLPSWPQFTCDSAASESLLVQLGEGIGQVRGLHSGLSIEDRERIALQEITQEAVHSFAIEGVALDAKDIEASVIASLSARSLAGASRRSDKVAQIMLEARDPALPLSKERLFNWHRMLFDKTGVEDIGQWRSFDLNIIKSARADREEILYQDPPPTQLDRDMADWLAALKQPKSRATPIHAALMHLWFESIHPFSDGNGRIGRAIIEHIFARTAALPFSLSRQIEADKRNYYVALQQGREVIGGNIDATPFVTWFLETMIKAADRGLKEARFLLQRNQFFASHTNLRPRQEKALRRLFDQGAERVALGLSAKNYGKIAKISPATATRDLNGLVGRGALMKGDEGGRSTRYYLHLPQ